MLTATQIAAAFLRTGSRARRLGVAFPFAALDVPLLRAILALAKIF